VAINGVAPSDIVERLKEFIPADGFNESWKMFRVNKKFAYLYALVFGYPDRFVVEFRVPGETESKQAVLVPVSAEALGTTEHDMTDLQFEITDDGRTAIVTIKSFAYSMTGRRSSRSSTMLFSPFADAASKISSSTSAKTTGGIPSAQPGYCRTSNHGRFGISSGGTASIATSPARSPSHSTDSMGTC